MQINRQQILFTLVSILVISTGLAGLNSIIAADDGNPTNTDLQLQPDVVMPSARIWLRLEIEGTFIEGESKVGSLDREGLIPVMSLSGGEYVPMGVDGRTTGRPVVEPIVIQKLVSKNSPQLHQTVLEGRIVTKAEFSFYRTNDYAIEEKYYQITIENSKISSMRTYTLDLENGVTLDMNEVTFSINTITWTDVINGIEYQWSFMA